MLKIKIKSPTNIIFEGEATKVTLPTKLGQITVLSGHENMIAILEVGLIFIDDKKKILCFNGVIDVNKDNVSILTEEALEANAKVVDEINNAIKSAKEGKPTLKILPSDLIKAEKELRYFLLKKDQES